MNNTLTSEKNYKETSQIFHKNLEICEFKKTLIILLNLWKYFLTILWFSQIDLFAIFNIFVLWSSFYPFCKIFLDLFRILRFGLEFISTFLQSDFFYLLVSLQAKFPKHALYIFIIFFYVQVPWNCMFSKVIRMCSSSNSKYFFIDRLLWLN